MLHNSSSLILHAIQFPKPYLDTFLCTCNSNALKTENQTILVLGNCQHVIPPFKIRFP